MPSEARLAAYLVLRRTFEQGAFTDRAFHRAALNKLAGKRNSLIVYVRVDMVLPSMLYKGGLPRSFVERITLKRTPAAKGHKPHKKH